jgi:hypothetical protein
LKRGLRALRITVAASMVGRDVERSCMPVITVEPAPVTRRFTVATAVGAARLASDPVRGRMQIGRVLMEPGRHSTLADRGAVMRDTGP